MPGVASSDGFKLGVLSLGREDVPQTSSLGSQRPMPNLLSPVGSQQSSQLRSQQSQQSEELCSQPLVGCGGESRREHRAPSSLGSTHVRPQARSQAQHEQKERLEQSARTHTAADSSTFDEGADEYDGDADDDDQQQQQAESQPDEEEKVRRELEERKTRRRERLAERKRAAANSGYYQPSSGSAEDEQQRHEGMHGGAHMLHDASRDRPQLSSSLGHTRDGDDDKAADKDIVRNERGVSKDSGRWNGSKRSSASHAETASGRHQISGGGQSVIQMTQQEMVSQQGLSQRHNKRSYKDKMRLLGLG